MTKQQITAITNPLAGAKLAFDSKFLRLDYPWAIILTVNK